MINCHVNGCCLVGYCALLPDFIHMDYNSHSLLVHAWAYSLPSYLSELSEAVFKAGCLVAGDIGERDLPPLSAPIKHPSFTGFLMPGTCRSFMSPHACTSCQLHTCTSLICYLMPGTFRLFTSPHTRYVHVCHLYLIRPIRLSFIPLHARYMFVIYTASWQVYSSNFCVSCQAHVYYFVHHLCFNK